MVGQLKPGQDTVADDTNRAGILALGAALSDGKIQIVALSAASPPRVAGTVSIQGFSSDIRLELQLNELLQTLPGGPSGLGVGIGYQATTNVDNRNLEWLTKSFARLEVPVHSSAPLADCIAQVKVGGNPHPVLQGAIGAALLALRSQLAVQAMPIADESEFDGVAPGASDLSVLDNTEPDPGVPVSQLAALLARIDALEGRADAKPVGVPVAEPQVDVTHSAETDDPVDSRDALDRRIDELAARADAHSTLAPEAGTTVAPETDGTCDPEATGPVPTIDGPASRARDAAIDSLTRQLEEEREASAAASAHVERLLGQLDVRIDDASGHTDELRRMNSLVDQAKTSLAEESSRNEKLRTQVSDLEAEVSRLTQKAADAEDERERTERRFGAVAARNDKLELKAEDLAEYQVEVFRLNARVSILEDKLDTERKRSKTAQERAARLRHDLLSVPPRPLGVGRTHTNRRVG